MSSLSVSHRMPLISDTWKQKLISAVGHVPCPCNGDNPRRNHDAAYGSTSLAFMVLIQPSGTESPDNLSFQPRGSRRFELLLRFQACGLRPKER